MLAAVEEAVDDPRVASVTAFARAALRRVPARQLAAADPHRTALRVLDAFRLMDTRSGDATTVRVLAPGVALDGSVDPGAVVQVCTRDRPFLLSTVTAELQARGLTPRRTLHPIVGVERGGDGRIHRVAPARGAAHRESFVHVTLDDRLSAAARGDLRTALEGLLDDVRVATDDYPAMCDRVRRLAERLRAQPPPGVDPAEASETAALLDWLLDDNLVLLGWREYRLAERDGGPVGAVVPDSGLGILRDASGSRFADPVPLSELPRELARRLRDPRLLTISRTNRRSTVHRRDRMDYFGVTRYDEDGAVAGEARLLGLFTRKAMVEPAGDTPVLRRKLATILEREDVVPASHDETTIESLFQALPKDELFQTGVDQLQDTIVGLLGAEEQGVTRVLLRIERFTRTVSVLVAVPRQRYGPGLRRDVQRLLTERFGAERVDADVSLGDRRDAVVRFTVHAGEHVPEVTAEDLEREVRRLTRSWDDRVAARLRERVGDPAAAGLARRVAARLPAAYREAVPLDHAVRDVRLLGAVDAEPEPFTVALHPPRRGDREAGRLKIVASETLALSAVVPVVESVGLTVLDEQPFRLRPGPAADPERPAPLVLHDLGVAAPPGLDVEADGPRLTEAISAAWAGRCEVDALNRLVLSAGLTWRQAAVLRAYRRLRRQLGTAYTPGYVNEALTTHPAVAGALVDLFDARFDPDAPAGAQDGPERRRAALERCDDVERLDHDRILRSFVELIGATLRTNAFRRDAVTSRPPRGRAATHATEPVAVPYLSLKIDAARISGVPSPVPHREVFVYSPDVEGVHLRDGPIARGGLRASDRRDDVRTEVLGLLRAQVLKNALIVPTGAKGGFVVKHRPSGTDAARAEVERQYVTFVRGLLDVTDDLEGDDVVGPEGVRRHDGDDPYLVVAADKGTATLSDTANRVAADYGFWLGDAFASGGSQGYDHKALGITARGAWLAVRRHFRELGIDTQHDPITVAGIGDMSGDVFGNGMLASRTIRLVAAFDHRDVFLDPDPDPQASFAERWRLFETPGSSWQDFDRSVISPGGGVFPRSAKQVELTPQVRELLDLDAETVDPATLVRAVLCCRVDLLFVGGIGTFVKASGGDHARVGDRVNDDVRVDADQLRARVVGEGANLAITQAGRIEYARRGGRINQDAIDNAGGVAISDREVNCKILLGDALQRDRIDHRQRHDLLEAATDDVVAGVLDDVDRQTRALTVEAARSARDVHAYRRLLADLETAGVVDRGDAGLPGDAELDERAAAGGGLTRPELATLLAATKRHLGDRAGAGRLPRQAGLRPLLEDYFPNALVDRFGDLLDDHRLRDRLVATRLANLVVDRMGTTFVPRLAADTDTGLPRALGAFWVAHRVAAAGRAWRGVDGLEGVLAPDRVRELGAVVRGVVARLTRAELRDPDVADDLRAAVDRDRPVYRALRDRVLELGTERQRGARRERASRLVDDLVDPDLAAELAGADVLRLAADVAGVARELEPGAPDAAPVADAFLRIGDRAGIDALQRLLDADQRGGRWHRRQRRGLAEDLWRAHRRAVAAVLSDTGRTPRSGVRGWLDEHRGELARTRGLIREVETDAEPPLEAVAVAVRTVRELLGGG